MNTLREQPDCGETRRVVVVEGEMVGPDAIVILGDLDHPGRTYRAIVTAGQAPDGIRIGDLAVIRWAVPRRGRRDVGPPRWVLVEWAVDIFVEESEPHLCGRKGPAG